MIDQALSEELHTQVLAEVERLKAEITGLSGSDISGDAFQDNESDAYDQHPADDASELFEREKNLTIRRTLEASLVEAEDALRKFDEGTYGLCESCGKPIAEKRLRALPAATHCIECQAKLEQQAQSAALRS